MASDSSKNNATDSMDDRDTRPTHHVSLCRWIFLLVLAIISVQMVILVQPLIHKHATCDSTFRMESTTRTNSSSVEEHDCGSSPTEAEANGCVFDLMRNNWTPPACYNSTAAEEAARLNPWTFYKDKNGTIPIAMPELQYESYVWSHYGYHLRHCAYVFQTAKTSLVAGHLVPSDIVDPAHLTHCGVELTEKAKHRAKEKMGTLVVFGTVKCVQYKS